MSSPTPKPPAVTRWPCSRPGCSTASATSRSPRRGRCGRCPRPSCARCSSTSRSAAPSSRRCVCRCSPRPTAVVRPVRRRWPRLRSGWRSRPAAAHPRPRRPQARRALETHPHLAAGMASGSVNADQARVIVRALDRLPTTGELAVDPEQRAGRGAPRRPRDRARREGPGGAGPTDLRGRRPRPRRGLRRTAPRGPGSSRRPQDLLHHARDPRRARARRFVLPVLHGAILHKAITGLASPVRGDGQVIDPDLPAPVRHGIAFTEVLEALPADPLPAVAGGDITIVVTMRHDQLLADLDAAGVATLDTGHHISAGEARRLACAHRIVPAVLDGASVPLDLGRTRRLHTKAQRLAMAQRDRGCTAVGCDRPPAWCQAHHDHPWARRPHRRHHRQAALRPPPPPHPRPRLPPPHPPRRHRRVPPTRVTRTPSGPRGKTRQDQMSRPTGAPRHPPCAPPRPPDPPPHPPDPPPHPPDPPPHRASQTRRLGRQTRRLGRQTRRRGGAGGATGRGVRPSLHPHP